ATTWKRSPAASPSRSSPIWALAAASMVSASAAGAIVSSVAVASTLSVAVPGVALAAASIVIVCVVALAAIVPGVAVTPVGAPVTSLSTAPAKPPAPPIVAVTVVDAPATTVAAVGARLSATLGAGFTVSATATGAIVTPVAEPVIEMFGVPADALASAATFKASVVLPAAIVDRKSTRLNSSHVKISYAVFCLKK